MKLALNHLNLPARDPTALRRWYVEKLGFAEYGRFLWSAGTLLVFTEGEPLDDERVHFGFRVESIEELRAWAARVGAAAPGGDENYMTTYVRDPEGNVFELFCEPVPDA